MMLTKDQFIIKLMTCIDNVLERSYCAWFANINYVYLSNKFKELLNASSNIISSNSFINAMHNVFGDFMTNINIQCNKYSKFCEENKVWLSVTFEPRHNMYIINAHKEYISDTVASTILDNIPISIWIQNIENNILYCNQQYATNLCKNKSNILDKPCSLIQHSNKNMYNRERRSITKFMQTVAINGQMKNLEITRNKMQEYTIYSAMDVTEREKSIATHCMYKNNIETVLHNISTPIVVFDMAMRLMFVNNAIKRLFNISNSQSINGYKLPELVNVVVDKFYIPDGLTNQNIREYVSQMCEFVSSIMESYNIVAQMHDGKNMNIGIYPMQDVGTMLVFEDISKTVSLKRELYEINQSNLQIIEYLNEGILVFGIDNRIKLINTKTKKIFGKDISMDYINEHINNFFDIVCNNDCECLRVAGEIIDVAYKREHKYGQLPIGANIKIDYQYVPLVDGMHLIKFF